MSPTALWLKLRTFLGEHLFLAITLTIFLILILVVVPVAVRYGPWIPFWGIAKDSGTIGDAIGGITAPFIGLFGALLVYYSFKEQVKANRLQLTATTEQAAQASRDRDLDIIFGLYGELRTSLDRIVIEGDVKGAMALRSIGVRLHRSPVATINSQEALLLEAFMIDVRIAFRKVRSSALDEEDRRLFLNKLFLFYRLEASEEMAFLITQLEARPDSILLVGQLRDIHNETHAGLIHPG
jgi:hypothetical protein